MRTRWWRTGRRILSSFLAWYQRQGRSLLVPCLVKTPSEESEKYAKASYLWRDGSGRGALKARATIFGNGSLHLRHLQPRDTDTYYCDAFLPDDTIDTIIHNVIGQPVLGLYVLHHYNLLMVTSAM